MNPIEVIKLHEKSFTKSEIIIMDSIQKHPDIIISYPITDVAKKMKVSKSALLRFCQKIGYNGFSEFKYSLSHYIQSGIALIDKQPNYSNEIIEIYKDTCDRLILPNYDSLLLDLSNKILNARKIKIFGIHESGLAAKQLYYRLITNGIDATFNDMDSTILDIARFSKKDDLCIFFSMSLTNEHINGSIENAQKSGATIALISQNDKSKYTKTVPLFFTLPTMNISIGNVFIDSQALNFIFIELLINQITNILTKKELM